MGVYYILYVTLMIISHPYRSFGTQLVSSTLIRSPMFYFIMVDQYQDQTLVLYIHSLFSSIHMSSCMKLPQHYYVTCYITIFQITQDPQMPT